MHIQPIRLRAVRPPSAVPRGLHRAILATAITAVALVGAAGAPAQTAPPTAEDEVIWLEPGASSEPTAPAQPPAPSAAVAEIAAGVTVAGVPVGGLSREQAIAAVDASFERPLRFRFEKRRWKAAPEQLGAKAYVPGAVARALRAAPGSEVELVVTVKGKRVGKYVAYLDETFSSEPREGRVRLAHGRPRVTGGRDGVGVRRGEMRKRIVRALKRGQRGPVRLAVTRDRPAVSADRGGDIVVIQRGSKRLSLYDGKRLVRRFGIATGSAAHPTPLGSFEIATKQRNPWWYPPQSEWARGLEPVPPGPGNPLGTRWMGLSAPLIGIHGTPDAASIGYSASHGCIRMHISAAEWLFKRIDVGTPVLIVAS